MVNEKNRISLFTGVLIVIANMIGISAFSNLGIQLMYQTSYIEVILVWILGALIALCGALSYAEVACIYPENGGEYSFLSKMYNPTIGFLAGWISITVGFPVSIALSAKVYASYFFADADQMFIASGIVIATTILHFLGYNSSMAFQKIVTLTIVIVFIVLITFGLISPSKSALYDNYSTINYAQDNLKVIKNFVIALIFISYSYTGWNSVTYMVADFKKPSRTVPRILFIGTLFVGICYVLLQVVLLKHLKYDELKGSLNVVMTFVNKLSDGQYTVVIKGFITLLFISSISIMTWVGSKVLYQMTIKSNTFSFLRSSFYAYQNIKILCFQGCIVLLILISGSFEQILVYCGFLLSMCSLLVVLGLVRIKNKTKDSIILKRPLSLLAQYVFIVFTFILIIQSLWSYPLESLIGCLNVLFGFIVFKMKEEKSLYHS